MEEELKQRRTQKLQLESASFWKFFLPTPIYTLVGYQKIIDDHNTTTTNKSKPLPLIPIPMNKPTVVTDDDDDTVVYHLRKLNETQQEELHQKLKVTKNVVKGKRENSHRGFDLGVSYKLPTVGFDMSHRNKSHRSYCLYLLFL